MYIVDYLIASIIFYWIASSIIQNINGKRISFEGNGIEYDVDGNSEQERKNIDIVADTKSNTLKIGKWNISGKFSEFENGSMEFTSFLDNIKGTIKCDSVKLKLKDGRTFFYTKNGNIFYNNKIKILALLGLLYFCYERFTRTSANEPYLNASNMYVLYKMDGRTEQGIANVIVEIIKSKDDCGIQVLKIKSQKGKELIFDFPMACCFFKVGIWNKCETVDGKEIEVYLEPQLPK